MNIMRTAILLAGLTALFMGVGFLIGGQSGILAALVVALAMNAVSYWNSDKIVLSMYGAQEVDARTAPEYYGIVQELSARAGLPMPRVFVIDNPQPNAFATGRDPEHAAVAATTGLLQLMSREEIAGVMAHELAHIKNRDTLIMTVTATIAGAISMLANFGMFFGGGQNRENGGNPLGVLGVIIAVVVAPFAAMLVQMAISRGREYEADRLGAEICGNPLWLASALRRLEGAARRVPNYAAESNPATAHMFIVNPLTGERMDSLFSTHPATENRVRALEELAGGTSLGAIAAPGRSAVFGPWGRSLGRPRGEASRGPWGGASRRPWG